MRTSNEVSKMIPLLVLLSLPFVAPFSHHSTRRRTTRLWADQQPSKAELLQQEIQKQIELAEEQRTRVAEEIEVFEQGIEKIEKAISVDKKRLSAVDTDVVKLQDKLSRVEAAAAKGSTVGVLDGALDGVIDGALDGVFDGAFDGAGFGLILPAVGIPAVVLAAGRQALLRRKQVEEQKRLEEEQRLKEEEEQSKRNQLVQKIGQNIEPKKLAVSCIFGLWMFLKIVASY